MACCLPIDVLCNSVISSADLKESVMDAVDLQVKRWDSEVRRELRTNEEARRQVIEEAIASFAFEGIEIPWEDASRMLDEVLEEPPAGLVA